VDVPLLAVIAFMVATEGVVPLVVEAKEARTIDERAVSVALQFRK